MRTVAWLEIESSTQKVCGIISIITNSFLIFLILTKSPPKLGAYKWLMLYTSFFELFYACLNFFVGPSIDTYNSVLIAFQDLDKVRDFKQKYLSGGKLLFLYIFPPALGVFWGIIVWLTMSETQIKTDYIRQHILKKFEVNIDECAYVSVFFWPKDTSGNIYPDVTSFIGLVFEFTILGISFFCVTYFAFNCYRWISRKLGNMENVSQAAKTLQIQLFYALIVQAAIPCVLMYLPAATVFTCPMLNINLDLKYPVLGVTIAIYPAIDPFPTILIIKNYRRGCIELLTCRWKKNQISMDYSHNGVCVSLKPNAPNVNNLLTIAAL
ncbi:hypothetical protein GCK72_016938 [Caenorhabditis remanei]|uniref:Seven TM Receptor n=1 Tax=Caenorhabditis remanei TaxID=31234 RepID=A0A6A5G7D2_CAERE|nr:hypothetical protein GCK72_016938 [Caenorhabditis remanei]KAF1750389.1 hypothetical protein GCK72_016938 [Caenorhabditis remanei]